jgi:hypothetical protein
MAITAGLTETAPQAWVDYVKLLDRFPTNAIFGKTENLRVLIIKMAMYTIGIHDITETKVFSILLFPAYLWLGKSYVEHLLTIAGRNSLSVDKVINIDQELFLKAYKVCSLQTKPVYRKREMVTWLVDE